LLNVLRPFEEEAAPGSEGATIVGHAGTPAWRRDDVMGRSDMSFVTITELLVGRITHLRPWKADGLARRMG
jgi:hypothetical protein